MYFAVCPHDIVKQMQTWLHFATWLGKKLDAPIQMESVTDFAIFYQQALPKAELAFLNPTDVWRLVHEHGFLPLFRTELYDEVVFITHLDNQQATLQDLAHQPLAAVEHQFASYLGLHILQQEGIPVGPIQWKRSWLEVIRAVMRGAVPYGLLYQDFHFSLSRLSRSQFHTLYESQTRLATHMFLVHPQHDDLIEPLRDLLSTMHTDPEGAAILQTLRLGRWVPVTDIAAIERVMALQPPRAGGA